MSCGEQEKLRARITATRSPRHTHASELANSEAIAEDFPDASGHSVYASGPPVMIGALKEVFDNNGLDAEFFYSDAFDYAAENE